MVRSPHFLFIAYATLGYLCAVEAASPRRIDGNRPETVSAFDDGRIALWPESAEFHGVEIRINPVNHCAAWWSKPEDFLRWQIVVPRDHEYEVWLEWSIGDDHAGNRFVVQAGEQRLSGQIEKTGGWTSFRRVLLGTLKLPAGRQSIEMLPEGELHGELADVRALVLNPAGKAPPPSAPDIPPMTPAASLNAIHVRPAMQVELVACEPLVRDPIAIAWGADLKLWVVEMGDYPLGTDGNGARGGRIKFLEDTNADGRYDKPTVFLDGLSFPTGVLPWRKGVLVTCAPDILYAEDTDGDGRADVRKPLLTGFPERNQQHRVNGLRMGLDNWVYCANGDGGVGGSASVSVVTTGQKVQLGSRDFRFDPANGMVEPQSGPTQFGRNRDDWGNWFGGNNGRPLYHFALDEHYLTRNPHLKPPDPRIHLFGVEGPFFAIAPPIAFHGESPIAAGPRQTGLSSACSGMIYRDNLLGAEFDGNAFVCDPVTNLVHRRVLSPTGATYRSARAQDEPASEFFASADPWTRPTMVQTGPDGALYVVDMYRLYIEHPQWIHPAVLARVDLRAGSDRGRIYRIYPRDQKPRSVSRLDKLKAPSLVAALESPSGWQRDIAQQRLVELRDRAVVPDLVQLAKVADRPQARLHALATLAGLGAIDDKLLLSAVRDAQPAVRRLAVQLAEQRLAEANPLSAAVVALAADADPKVRIQVAYSLGEWDDPRSGACLGRMIATDCDDPYLVAAALSSAAKQPAALIAAVLDAEPPVEAALLSHVFEACVPNDGRAIGRLIAEHLKSPRLAEAPERRFAVLAALLRTNIPADVRAQIITAANPQFEIARRLLADSAANDAHRVAGIRMLAWQDEHLAADLKLLSDLLAASAPLTLADAALDRLAQLGDEQVGRLLADQFIGLSPRLKSKAADILLSREEWSLALLSTIAGEPRLNASLDPSRQQRLLSHASEKVRALAEQTLGKAPHSDRRKVTAEYASAADRKGDPEHGREVFKTNCSACHRLENVGKEVGPNLAGLKDKSPPSMLEAILDPNRAVEEKFLAYNAVTNDGRSFSGLVQVESGNSITLIAADGQVHMLLRGDLQAFAATGRSLMPEGFEKTISPSAMSDLLSYLTHSSTNMVSAQPEGSESRMVVAEVNGTMELLPHDAKLQGERVGINADAGCIAWMTENDLAEWSIEVPNAGEYEVQIEWAQIDELAGNPFAVHVADSRLTGEFPSTHGWNRYVCRSFGTLKLPAGRSQLVFRPNGEVKTELADVRKILLSRTDKQR